MTGREGLFYARHFLTVETLGKEALLLVRYPKTMFKKITIVSILLFVSQTVLAQKVQPMPTPVSIAQLQTLDEKIKSEIKDFSGKVWIYAKNLDTGKDYALRADEQVRTASTIKLPIMTEVFHQVANGKLNWTDEIILTKQNKQGGSGILFEFSDNTKIDLKTVSKTNLNNEKYYLDFH